MDLLREVIRVLMSQVREEQRLRSDCLQGKEDRSPIPTVSDAEVEARITEVKEGLLKDIDKNEKR